MMNKRAVLRFYFQNGHLKKHFSILPEDMKLGFQFTNEDELVNGLRLVET